MRLGAITFDKVEVKFDLDENGNPTGVYFKESKEANKLIEEFMLLANRKVAEYVAKMKKTFVYRVHDEPDADKLQQFNGVIARFGYSLNLNNSIWLLYPFYIAHTPLSWRDGTPFVAIVFR